MTFALGFLPGNDLDRERGEGELKDLVLQEQDRKKKSTQQHLVL